jgi:hypothetical protein
MIKHSTIKKMKGGVKYPPREKSARRPRGHSFKKKENNNVLNTNKNKKDKKKPKPKTRNQRVKQGTKVGPAGWSDALKRAEFIRDHDVNKCTDVLRGVVDEYIATKKIDSTDPTVISCKEQMLLLYSNVIEVGREMVGKHLSPKQEEELKEELKVIEDTVGIDGSRHNQSVGSRALVRGNYRDAYKKSLTLRVVQEVDKYAVEGGFSKDMKLEGCALVAMSENGTKEKGLTLFEGLPSNIQIAHSIPATAENNKGAQQVTIKVLPSVAGNYAAFYKAVEDAADAVCLEGIAQQDAENLSDSVTHKEKTFLFVITKHLQFFEMLLAECRALGIAGLPNKSEQFQHTMKAMVRSGGLVISIKESILRHKKNKTRMKRTAGTSMYANLSNLSRTIAGNVITSKELTESLCKAYSVDENQCKKYEDCQQKIKHRIARVLSVKDDELYGYEFPEVTTYSEMYALIDQAHEDMRPKIAERINGPGPSCSVKQTSNANVGSVTITKEEYDRFMRLAAEENRSKSRRTEPCVGEGCFLPTYEEEPCFGKFCPIPTYDEAPCVGEGCFLPKPGPKKSLLSSMIPNLSLLNQELPRNRTHGPLFQLNVPWMRGTQPSESGDPLNLSLGPNNK